MSDFNGIPAEVETSTKATVIAGLGYPAGRAEVSPVSTGWQQSATLADGSAEQTKATIVSVASVSSSDR